MDDQVTTKVWLFHPDDVTIVGDHSEARASLHHVHVLRTGTRMCRYAFVIFNRIRLGGISLSSN